MNTYEPFEKTDESATKASDNKEKKLDNKDVVKVVEEIFTNANLFVLAAFLVIYLIVFVGGGMFMKASEITVKMTFDFVMFLSLIAYAAYKYMNTENKGNVINTSFTKMIELYDNDLALFSIMLFVIGFYLLLFILRVPTNENKPISVTLIEGVSWFFLATLAIHNCLKYLFNIDVLEYLRGKNLDKYLDPDQDDNDGVITSLDASGNILPLDTSGNPEPVPEVYNVSNNLYNYEDAQAICKSLDARLATYEEIETAYTNGAEWCNYGWSADQLALFPTQKETWRELQGDCKSKNKCGRPGINGGYFRNPNIKFGVNCFGVKPAPNEDEKLAMNDVPRTANDARLDQKAEYWKENADKLSINTFNKKEWSRY